MLPPGDSLWLESQDLVKRVASRKDVYTSAQASDLPGQAEWAECRPSPPAPLLTVETGNREQCVS